MAKLVDALASGASARKGMRVRISPSAQFILLENVTVSGTRSR